MLLQERHPIAFADARRLANSSGRPITVVPTRGGNVDLCYGERDDKGSVVVRPEPRV